ncbi:hypothetical protein ACH4S8_43985 [Streptomyces sp. NPDC021080]|uniref:hypothetical protein n=1 Tax=Streptomyces sp. NPDC021080 TaxID=3365110 RepID=UPI0037B08EB1
MKAKIARCLEASPCKGIGVCLVPEARSCTQIARSVMDVLHKRGERVREDVAVMGFDNWHILT